MLLQRASLSPHAPELLLDLSFPLGHHQVGIVKLKFERLGSKSSHAPSTALAISFSSNYVRR